MYTMSADQAACKITGVAISTCMAPFMKRRTSGHLRGFFRVEWYNGKVGDLECIGGRGISAGESVVGSPRI